LLADLPKGPVAIEIKYSLSPKLAKGFWNGYEDLKYKKGFIVYPGEEYYPVGKNVFALPVKDLKKIFE
jgi:predicted AAA+ superfamily ATPase